jgi:hypothetical protein
MASLDLAFKCPKTHPIARHALVLSLKKVALITIDGTANVRSGVITASWQFNP